jgi:CRP-like cAMP-binding protein
MTEQNERRTYDAKAILARIAGRKSESRYRKDQILYSQGDPADTVFYLQAGRLKVAVASPAGKEAVVGILQPGDFCGEECLAGHQARIATAAALAECALVQMAKADVLRALRDDPAFLELFISHLMTRSIRMQEDMVEQLLNSTEKRLARILVILANFGKEGQPEQVIPRISQETLADMVGTSRTHVNFFMNKFRQMGFIEYNGEIKVRRTLLNILLHDRSKLES